jgi:hypothetical protein
MPDSDLVATLNQQLAKYDAAIAEFSAIDSQLRLQARNARVADMLRLNRETINAIERSAELIRERLRSATASRNSATPFASPTQARSA